MCLFSFKYGQKILDLVCVCTWRSERNISYFITNFSLLSKIKVCIQRFLSTKTNF